MWKKIALGLLAFILLFILVGFLLPGKMEVSRSISVNAPAEYSFDEINELENWQHWSYWNTLDSTMVVSYGDKRSGVDSWYSWKSNDMGEGKLTITESVPFQGIKADLDFMENGTAKSWYTFEPQGDSTKVTMGFESEYGLNPIMRWVGATIMQSEMNKAFDYSLAKIKERAESKPKFSVKITKEQVNPVSYIGISHSMSSKDMNALTLKMGQIYTELEGALKKPKVEMNGHPFCIIKNFTSETIDFTCAMPVPPDAKLSAKYPVMTTEGGTALKAIHLGSYDDPSTHEEMNRYIEFKKLTIAGSPWEVYLTDPFEEPDTAKWVTEVYYPVK